MINDFVDGNHVALDRLMAARGFKSSLLPLVSPQVAELGVSVTLSAHTGVSHSLTRG